jgi:proteasome lid subunit RPN8/RPN11
MELPRPMFEDMVAHARADLPNEACGVIAGDRGKPVRLYPMRNAEQSPVVYRFDEREQLQVFNEIEEKGWELLGLFHSHTHTEAYPSPTDRAQAHWRDPVTGEESAAYPGTKYLILSLAEQDPLVRAFTFLEGVQVEEDVRIV